MKKFVLAVAALVSASGSAFAADLAAPAYKAPPPAAPISSWTGCFIDGGVGYGLWKEDHHSETYPGLAALSVTTTNGGSGWLGSVGAGCDYQVGSRFIIGAFGDFDFTDIHGAAGGIDAGFNLTGDEKERDAWGVGGRIGYLVTPSLLTYFDGGYTEARFDQINLNSGFPPMPTGLDIAAHTYHGWFIGGGAEYSLASIVPISGLFWRTEYRYASYHADDLPLIVTATGAPFVSAEHMQPVVQTITTSLVWRFNFGGPLRTRD